MSTTPRARATLLVAGLFLAGLTTGAWTGAAAAARAHDPYAQMELLARIYTLISDNYVDEIDDEALVSAAVRGMVQELDPHSRWMSAEEYSSFRDDAKGSYEGIGVEVRRIPEGVMVSRALAGGPAERDGILAGDHIVAVDGVSIAGFSLDAVAARLKGPRGEPVVVTLVREGWDAPKDVRTVRDRVHTPSVLAEALPDGMAYVRLVQFQEGTARDLRAKLDELSKPGPLTALVLDLRDNPGGLLEEAVAVSDLFLDDGLIVSTQSRVEGRVEHPATQGGLVAGLPVVVLVNGMSASASEIVAGALQDTGRARIVGTRTYGKGTVQTLYRNADDSALKLTIGRYYTPSGEPVADRSGREPDNLVPGTPSAPGVRAQLQERVQALEIGDEDRAGLLALIAQLPVPEADDGGVLWDRTAAERLETDPQLRYAVDLLR